MKRFTIVLALLAGLCGCAATSLPPVTAKDFAFEDDEKRLWNRSEEEEQAIAKSGILYRDRELEAYLNDVARKLEPPEAYKQIPFRILVIKNLYCNAFAMPNGYVYIHTGFLARMGNEAQLATLLAHEMTHATYRHHLREFRGSLNKSMLLASTRSIIGGLPGIGELSRVLGDISAKASISGHSRELETEADMEGIKLVVNAGYDPREAPKLFEHLKAEMQEEGQKEPFFFSTHPRLQERMDNYNDFLAERGKHEGGAINKEAFLKKVSRVIIDNAFMDFRAGRFMQARSAAEKYLSIRPKDGRGYFLLAEISRQKGEEGDLAEAKKLFQKGLSVDPSYPDTYKGLGLIYFKEGKKSQAAKALKSYLSKAPHAADRSYIEDYVSQCR
jgi:predicted Zn-dependent protease